MVSIGSFNIFFYITWLKIWYTGNPLWSSQRSAPRTGPGLSSVRILRVAPWPLSLPSVVPLAPHCCRLPMTHVHVKDRSRRSRLRVSRVSRPVSWSSRSSPNGSLWGTMKSWRTSVSSSWSSRLLMGAASPSLDGASTSSVELLGGSLISNGVYTRHSGEGVVGYLLLSTYGRLGQSVPRWQFCRTKRKRDAIIYLRIENEFWT